MRIKTKLINAIGAVERVVEKVVEVPFTFRREVDIHDFEVHLIEAMEAHKTKYWNKTYVPNVYILQLREEIYQRYCVIKEQLQAHLTTFIKRSIFERGYSSVADVVVEVTEGEPEQESEIEIICHIRREIEKDVLAQLKTPDKTYEMTSKILTIGRDESNDVVLDSPHVSAKHARIQQNENGDFILIDLNSTNGSEVNSLAITEPTTIDSGDELTFGDVSLTFMIA